MGWSLDLSLWRIGPLGIRLGVGVDAMAKRPVRTADILDGHVSLDLECLDRIYLNGYVPNLQVGGQVVQFLALRGFPIPSPVVVGRIGDQFRRSVRSFAEATPGLWRLPPPTKNDPGWTMATRIRLGQRFRRRRPSASRIRSGQSAVRTRWQTPWRSWSG